LKVVRNVAVDAEHVGGIYDEENLLMDLTAGKEKVQRSQNFSR
jgi:hypothetical protein